MKVWSLIITYVYSRILVAYFAAIHRRIDIFYIDSHMYSYLPPFSTPLQIHILNQTYYDDWHRSVTACPIMNKWSLGWCIWPRIWSCYSDLQEDPRHRILNKLLLTVLLTGGVSLANWVTRRTECHGERGDTVNGVTWWTGWHGERGDTVNGVTW